VAELRNIHLENFKKTTFKSQKPRKIQKCRQYSTFSLAHC